MTANYSAGHSREDYERVAIDREYRDALPNEVDSGDKRCVVCGRRCSATEAAAGYRRLELTGRPDDEPAWTAYDRLGVPFLTELAPDQMVYIPSDGDRPALCSACVDSYVEPRY